jgi:hypothetical protein
MPLPLSPALGQRDAHGAGFGELDGVVAEVEQDLGQRAAVGLQHDGGAASSISSVRFLQRQRAQRVDHVLDHVLALHGFQFQRDLARFDLGHVEDVVDQREQVARAGADGVELLVLLVVSGPGSFISSAPVKPMMALSGVRSSCDILAMKADFMRLASASSRFFSAISRLMVSSSPAWWARRMFSSITWRSRACSSALTCTACS